MKLITLHKRTAYIQYKNTICSWTASFVFLSIILTIWFPYYLAFHLFSDVWSQNKIIYEQPDIRFQYKYIFVAELEPTETENLDGFTSSSIACTSYSFLNQFSDTYPDCSTIRFWEKDTDFDQRNDLMNYQLSFESKHGYTLKSLTIFMLFDAKLNRQCHLQIPAALILHQLNAPKQFSGGRVLIEADLKLIQRTAFHCPFFLREMKSHFYHTLIPENAKNIRDFEMNMIRKKLFNNPAHISNDQSTSITWNPEPSNNIVLNIDVKIDETVSRYHTSFWQRLGHIWIHYFSFFLVCAYAMEKLQQYVFSRQIVRAWEIVPWKKFY